MCDERKSIHKTALYHHPAVASVPPPPNNANLNRKTLEQAWKAVDQKRRRSDPAQNEGIPAHVAILNPPGGKVKGVALQALGTVRVFLGTRGFRRRDGVRRRTGGGGDFGRGRRVVIRGGSRGIGQALGAPSPPRGFLFYREREMNGR